VVLFLGLLSVILAFGIVVLLPLLSWARTHRMDRELTELRARLAALEEEIRLGRARGPAGADSFPSAAPASEPLVPAAPSTDAEPEPRPAAPAPEMPMRLPELPAGVHGSTDREGLEAAIGGRLMLWVGTIVLVLGVAFFLKYAFDNDWITETMRVLLGAAAGLALAAIGHRFAGRGFRAYGQILTGGGLAVLYLAIYAAFDYYTLIGQTPAFLLLVAVTVGAAWMADRQNALGLALMGVGGGFATPFLVSSGVDAQVTLFSYDALLVMGTLYLARRRDWPVLNLVSFAAAWFTIFAWGNQFYSPEKWRRTEVFLTLFCALFLGILRAERGRHGWRSPTALVLALGPAIYHLSSLAVLGWHGAAPLVYLIAVTLVTVAAAARVQSTAWRVVCWGAVVPPLLAWLSSHGTSHWLFANLVAACGIFAMHALAQLDVVFRHERKLGRLDAVLFHLNGYALVAALYLALENVALSWAPTAALAVAALHAGLAWTFRPVDRTAALHALAVALGAVTIACALRLDGPWLTVALAVEGGLVIWLGLQLDEGWFRIGGAGVLMAGVLRYAGLSLPITPVVFALFQDEPFAMGAALAAVLYGVAWVYRRHGTTGLREGRLGLTIAVLLASGLLIVACSAENDIYWNLRGDVSADARFASSLALSGVWVVGASVFIAVGLWRDFAPIRFLAMALFGLTVLKVFLVDLSALGGIYRILGFIGVGLVLLAVSFLYQRTKKKSSPEPETL
jgi:uncharacterized membrane protein